MRIAVRAVIGIAMLAVALGIFSLLAQNRPRPAQVTEQAPPRVVRVLEAQEIDLPRRYSGFGTTIPVRATTVAAESTPTPESTLTFSAANESTSSATDATDATIATIATITTTVATITTTGTNAMRFCPRDDGYHGLWVGSRPL